MSVEITTLDNGLRVASDVMANVESAALGVWVQAGTRHEPDALNGISHMLEHMAFKGTETRSARAIAEEIEAVGGHLNAYTGREGTAYHVTVLKEDVALALDLIADILLRSRFDGEELERERHVILQEIGQAADTPDDVIFDRFQEIAYPGQAMGRPVLGDAKSVAAITRQQLIDYQRQHYTADRMILAAAGAVDHARLVDMAQAKFAGVAAGQGGFAMSPGRYRGGEIRESRELEQLHLTLGFEAIGYRDPDYYALAVFSTLFGGGMSSRLFQTVREERGLVYSIYSFNPTYADGGLFGIYAGTGPDDVAALMPLVCQELATVADTLGEAELVRARAQLKAGTLMALESSGNRCETLARQLMIWNRPIPYTEIVSRIEAVDQAAIRRIIGRILVSKPTLAALGPLGALESLDQIAARLAA